MAKPKVSFQVEPEDEAAIAAVTSRVKQALPGLRDQAKSITMRAALRLGLEALARDPEQAAKVEPPTIDESASDAKRKR
jgi:hypothetical protein